MEVLINDRQDLFDITSEFIKKIALEIMKFEGMSESSELSLVFCDDDFIQKLNKDYRGKNEPTDVLSFPMKKQKFETEVTMLGDIVISVETANRQADSYKHPIILEIVFLLLHGLLHLNGYRHSNKADRKKMKDREVSILQHLCDKKILDCVGYDNFSPVIKRVPELD